MGRCHPRSGCGGRVGLSPKGLKPETASSHDRMPRVKEIVFEVGRFNPNKGPNGAFEVDDEVAVIEQADGEEGRQEFRLRYRYVEDGKRRASRSPPIIPPAELQRLVDIARQRGYVR